jgi:hypothetical protein
MAKRRVLEHIDDDTASYAAFCRKNGWHSTGAIGSRNWNEEAIDKMARDLTTPWQGLKSTVENMHEGIIESIEKLTDWMTEYIGKYYTVKDIPYLSFSLRRTDLTCIRLLTMA